MLKEKYEFKLFADYHQFYLQDEQADGDLSDSWTEQATTDLFALTLGTIGIGTVSNSDIPVTVEVYNSEPDNDFDEWDRIIECSINVPSGRIVVAGCTDYFPEAARISVEPGVYQARVFYGELDSLSEDGCDSNDKYKIALWLGETINPKVIKKQVKD
jgi:hypothetical protein